MTKKKLRKVRRKPRTHSYTGILGGVKEGVFGFNTSCSISKPGGHLFEFPKRWVGKRVRLTLTLVERELCCPVCGRRYSGDEKEYVVCPFDGGRLVQDTEGVKVHAER